MHSSRMRTARLLTVSQHALPGGVYLVGGVPSQGSVPAWEGVHAHRGCTCLGGGTWPGTPPPWTEWLTDRCKNITLPQTSFAGGKNTTLCKKYIFIIFRMNRVLQSRLWAVFVSCVLCLCSAYCVMLVTQNTWHRHRTQNTC